MGGSSGGSTGTAPSGTAPGGAERPLPARERRNYLVALGWCTFVGAACAPASFFFTAIEEKLRGWLWTDLPHGLGFARAPDWWGMPVLAVAGLAVAIAITRLPGNGGHVPAEGFMVRPTEPSHLPGVVAAALAGLSAGAVLGPEAPLLAVGGALGLLTARRLARLGEGDPRSALLAASGSAAALSTLFGSPLVSGVMLAEASGYGGLQLMLTLLPALLSSAVAALLITALGDWTGLPHPTLGIPSVPPLTRPDAPDVLWAVAIGILGALACRVIRGCGVRVARPAGRYTMAVTPVIGVAVGALAALVALLTDRGPEDVLFSGQTAIAGVVEDASTMHVATAALLLVGKAAAYALCLGSFRGGPIFPALFLGSVAAVVLAPLPGLGFTAALAACLAAFCAGMLRALPLNSVVLVVLLLGATGFGLASIVVIAAVFSTITAQVVGPRSPS